MSFWYAFHSGQRKGLWQNPVQLSEDAVLAAGRKAGEEQVVFFTADSMQLYGCWCALMQQCTLVHSCVRPVHSTVVEQSVLQMLE